MAVTRNDVLEKLRTRVEALKATWVGLPLAIEYDNLASVNTSTQQHPYLCVSMVFLDGFQIDLSASPGHRVLGSIVIESKAKEGSGNKAQNSLLDHFYRGVHMTDTMTPLRTYAARFSSKPAFDGWTTQAAIIPFWYDSLP